ncbi:hypothetical protein L914_03686 [Phytophthora nicotianae]|uniref:Uncharacterized protein n=1 Tax=Phytophthora nicotianae TaxID=4792 RepID=W2NVX4_PHYNI|nr:hypothetical protein L914_03686 [Phytophthora nicotianae]
MGPMLLAHGQVPTRLLIILNFAFTSINEVPAPSVAARHRLLCVHKYRDGLVETRIGNLLELLRRPVHSIIAHFKKHGHAKMTTRMGRKKVIEARQDR